MIINASELVLSDYDASMPVIGIDSVITTLNVASTTEAEGFPITNVANPATHLKWKADFLTAGVEVITITTNSVEEIDYVAIAKHNFGSDSINVTVSGSDTNLKVLLLFDDQADASTTITDTNTGGSAHTWTAVGNAQIDTAEFASGVGSLLLDGTGDWVTTPDHADFTLGVNDFTVDGWFNCTASSGTIRMIAGQRDSAGSISTLSFQIFRETTNQIRAGCGSGSSTIGDCLGTTQFTSVINPGWHHFAYVRSGSNFYLFIDGALEATATSSSTVNDSTTVLAVGRIGDLPLDPWQGWIDSFRLTNGLARWTAAFTPPTTTGLLSVTPSDDLPLILRFEPQVMATITLTLVYSGDVPEAAVIYCGKLLQLERSIDIQNDHVPISMGRKLSVVNGLSESGNFLGRIVLNEVRESTASFAHFQPDWYRANFDPFIDAAQELPFFWAWNPSEYPLEVGYVWLVNDPQAQVSPVTRRVAVELQMRGVA